MGGNYFPDDILLKDFFNFNLPSFVQFFHRNTAYLIFFISLYLAFKIFKRKKTHLYKNLYIYFLFIFTQIVLGILVLISGANIYLASLHQISSIFLILAIISLYYRSIRS